jgi:hypothetical protein
VYVICHFARVDGIGDYRRALEVSIERA